MIFFRPLGIEVKVQNLNEMNFEDKKVSGFLFQYPDTDGSITNLEEVIAKAKKSGVSLNSIVIWYCIALNKYGYSI